jgi:hypothetical protein
MAGPVTRCGFLLLVAGLISIQTRAQDPPSSPPDSTLSTISHYDPFGPENAPDHTGQGSGGVVIPGPYESTVQGAFTRINADYYGIQYMFDSPLQISAGSGWSVYENNVTGFLFKLRTTGFKGWTYDPLREENVPYYLFSTQASFEYPYREHGFRSYKVRTHLTTSTRGLGMPGIGIVQNNWNLLIAGDRTMGRRIETELTWLEISGGYVMPLSPRKGGVNIALCFAVDLLGLKYQAQIADPVYFIGGKIGSIGWTTAVGWNMNSLVNLTAYLGGEYGFSTGALITPSRKAVFADIARTTVYFGLQATGRWVNIVGGVQKEWEYVDFQSLELSDRALRYYLGINVYVRR